MAQIIAKWEMIMWKHTKLKWSNFRLFSIKYHYQKITDSPTSNLHHMKSIQHTAKQKLVSRWSKSLVFILFYFQGQISILKNVPFFMVAMATRILLVSMETSKFRKTLVLGTNIMDGCKIHLLWIYEKSFTISSLIYSVW